MLLIYLLVLAAFSTAVFVLARRAARRRATVAKAHSAAGYHGAWALIWAAVPALIILILASTFDARIERAVLIASAPEAVQALDAPRRAAFIEDARIVGAGGMPRQIWTGDLSTALQEEAARASRVDGALAWGGLIAAILAALIGAGLAWRQTRPEFRARNRVETFVGVTLFACSVVAILTTIGIVASLLFESLRFFQMVPITEFLFGTQWSPQIAIRADQVGSTGAFGAVPLFVGTFLIMIIAMIVAGPIGLFSAIYLAEYAGPKRRAVIKPVLEILAGVPTVVYGFFAALTVGPSFRAFFNWMGAQLVGGPLDGLGQHLLLVQNQMALVAGAVMGIMLIPFVSSLSDDIINAVPQSLRDGSYAMGATKSETIKRVVLPAALPGIAGAFLLAVSRAIGETMIVTMAAGLAARTTLNPLETVTTVTVQIVTLLTGDQEFNSAKTLAAFGLGLTLFVVTLILNFAAQRIVQTYREQYD
ncbi:phosphate ABC transporter permease subunit PstC [Brevundimonas sp.]|uniref:phosphate ABC transporter permease subunit PstC n=1 Tax=Brevundimonas sp. TaxID=1871086 RepID=UPI001DB910B2|nr:phosphate ABC transporter permease subunit PstC [Brevundimonas sp.]MBA3999966.1 phosphate ABC transporter permease subunit PstC [Brevundimonas sp.]